MNIGNINDLLNEDKYKDIMVWAENHPLDDYICACLKIENYNFPLIEQAKQKGSYVCGSSALRTFINNTSLNSGEYNNWESKDTDIFQIGCENNSVTHPTDTIDIVNSTYNSIDELLISFDLSVCRLGINYEGMLYITAQALYSIITGYMFIPMYTKDIHQFRIAIMEDISTREELKEYLSQFNDVTAYILSNYNRRVEKYINRGFKPKYIETTRVPNYILTRIKYLIPDFSKCRKMDDPTFLHKFSKYNKELLKNANYCGCFYCLEYFKYNDITDWCDGDVTALCPKCGIDSVIGCEIKDDRLNHMNIHWFNK